MGDNDTTANSFHTRSRDDSQPPGYYRNDAARRSGPASTLRAKHKAVPKGHEAFLKALETSGATVEFEKASSGDIVTGTIKASDKYTVSVRELLEEGKQRTRVLFKHDISEFSPIYAEGGVIPASELGLVGSH